LTFFEIACEAHSCGATIYVVGLFGDIVASRIERWVASLPDAIVKVRLDLRGVSYIDPASFVRVARVLTGWRDMNGGPAGRRVNMEFPERSRSRLQMQSTGRRMPHGEHQPEGLLFPLAQSSQQRL
jgi:hypothetical protein